jgi:hypothetical protein
LDTELSGLVFVNSKTRVNVPLFLSEIVIDSDGSIYPSMIVFETFFNEYKDRIKISDFNKTLELMNDDFGFWDDELYIVNEHFIKDIIEKKFGKILKNDYAINEILGNFFMKIK